MIALGNSFSPILMVSGSGILRIASNSSVSRFADQASDFFFGNFEMLRKLNLFFTKFWGEAAN